MASSSSRPRRSRAAATAATSAAAARTRRPAYDGQPVFRSRNYTLLGLSLALIVVGYVLMRAENKVEGVLSLYVSPLLLLAGYLGVIYAILWRPRRSPTAAREAAVGTPTVALDGPGPDA